MRTRMLYMHESTHAYRRACSHIHAYMPVLCRAIEEEQTMSEGVVRAFFELGALPDGAAPLPLPAALDGDDADA